MKCPRCERDVLCYSAKGCKNCEGKPKPRAKGYFRMRQRERMKDPEYRAKYNEYQREYKAKRKKDE